jgi:hypothetical protein
MIPVEAQLPMQGEAHSRIFFLVRLQMDWSDSNLTPRPKTSLTKVEGEELQHDHRVKLTLLSCVIVRASQNLCSAQQLN